MSEYPDKKDIDKPGILDPKKVWEQLDTNDMGQRMRNGSKEVRVMRETIDAHLKHEQEQHDRKLLEGFMAWWNDRLPKNCKWDENAVSGIMDRFLAQREGE